MKFNTATKEVQSFGEISKKKISISANAKAYRLIFGQIYPDIIKAIVRELFTNAWDSQKISNNLETPIDIHLPSKWEPYFGIRDYGTGMTPDVIDKIYSNVFESSKDQSNDEAGMFGMGSKTPLGYVDAFSIISYVNGIYWYYDIHMDETGSAVISLKATGETVEPNGVDVQVAVLEKDFDTFKNYVEHFAYGANTPVNINREKFLNVRKIFKSGEGWELYEITDKNSYETVHIRMGCVLYALKFIYIEKFIDHAKRNKINSLINKPFVLDYSIGTFAVTGSREDIIYDDNSRKLIVDRLLEIANVMIEESAKDIQNSSSYYEAWLKYLQYKKVGFYPESPKYGAIKLSNYIRHIKGLEFFYDPIKKSRISPSIKDGERHNFNASNIYPSGSYEKTYKKVYFVAINKNNIPDSSEINKKLANIVNSFEKYNLDHTKKNYYKNAEIVLVYYTDIRRLNRMFVYLPTSGKCNTVVVKIEDIESYKKPKSAKVSVAKIQTCEYLTFTRYSVEIAPPYSLVKIEPNAFYVNVRYSEIEESTIEIRKAKTFFDKKYGKEQTVLAIGKSKRFLIKQYNLIDILDKYDEEMKNVTYNDDTFSMFSLKEATKRTNSSLLKNSDFLNKYLPKYSKDFDNIDPLFDSDANDIVKKIFNDKIEEINTVLLDFIQKYPIIKYIDEYQLESNFKEIEQLI